MTAVAPFDRERWERLLGVLACIHCGAPVEPTEDHLRCARCGQRFPILRGRPVFLPVAEPVQIMPDSHLSNPVPHYFAAAIDPPDGVALNLGAGGTRARLANCFELERAVFRNTDIVADAGALPFRDGVFDVVCSFNTFEHLPDPAGAAREIERVLRPGGRLFLHTAFLQPGHELPRHFYGATESGVRHWFAGLEIERCFVSENFHPGFTLGWIAAELLDSIERHQGPEARRAAAESRLADWADIWRDPAAHDSALARLARSLPKAEQATIAAGFELVATKRNP